VTTYVRIKRRSKTQQREISPYPVDYCRVQQDTKNSCVRLLFLRLSLVKQHSAAQCSGKHQHKYSCSQKAGGDKAMRTRMQCDAKSLQTAIHLASLTHRTLSQICSSRKGDSGPNLLSCPKFSSVGKLGPKTLRRDRRWFMSAARVIHSLMKLFSFPDCFVRMDLSRT